MNRNLEVPISFFKLKPCKHLYYNIWRKYETEKEEIWLSPMTNSIFEVVKIKLNQLYVLLMHLINLMINYL